MNHMRVIRCLWKAVPITAECQLVFYFYFFCNTLMVLTLLLWNVKRYLCFFHGAVCEVFNVGDYRRRMCGAQKPYQWFDSSNQEGFEAREVNAVFRGRKIYSYQYCFARSHTVSGGFVRCLRKTWIQWQDFK